MLNLPVYWYEGMFLRPQHFQAAERYWTEIVGQSSQIDAPYNYGFMELELSSDAIDRGEFGILRATFRMRDGTVWSLSSDQCPDRVSFKAALEQHSNVTILLAIPTLQSFRENVGTTEGDAAVRYARVEKMVVDENGGDPQEIELRRPAFRLMLSTSDTSGYELLEVGRVKRSGDGKSVGVLDETFFPPLLNIATWPHLREGILRSLHDQIAAKLELFGERVRQMGARLAIQDGREFEKVFFVHQLNEAYASLGVFVRSNGVHPLTVYHELARIMGQFSIFVPTERVCGEIKPYDHTDLAGCFRWIRDEIVRRMQVTDDPYQTSRFIGNASAGMEAFLFKDWLGERWKWYVGARSADVDTEKLTQLLVTTDEFVWKLASPSTIDMAWRGAARGLEFRALSQVPFPLPGNRRWVYFEVTKASGDVWDAVQQELALAIQFKRNAISGIEKLDGSKTIKLQGRAGVFSVEMGLFAVPTS